MIRQACMSVSLPVCLSICLLCMYVHTSVNTIYMSYSTCTLDKHHTPENGFGLSQCKIINVKHLTPRKAGVLLNVQATMYAYRFTLYINRYSTFSMFKYLSANNVFFLGCWLANQQLLG